MTLDRRWVERGEALGPALLAGVALLLDLAEEGESFLHAAAVAVVAVGAALSGAAAVLSLGRFGPSRLARRFSLWRACGLFAAAGCLGLEVAVRVATPRLAYDGTLQLTVLGGAWALLTGWVWGRRSWERLREGLRLEAEEMRVATGRPMRWARSEWGET